MKSLRSFVLACAAPVLLVTVGEAQAPASRELQPVRGWERPGLDIRPTGGWRVKARAVAATRAGLRARRDFRALNAGPSVGGAVATVVQGTLEVPAIMFRYQNSPADQYARPASQYNATLFSAAPPNGKPYTLRTFYEEMSNGLFSIQGQSVGWLALDSAESAYTGAAGTCPANPFGSSNCNGLFSGAAFARMQTGLVEALADADGSVSFGAFDNDGPDGNPNSGDDDGVVDAVLFLHASMDGACVTQTNNHLWSHRSALFYLTNDPANGGGNIVVRDYILQSGLGHPTGGVCDSTAIMPIGTAAHELGHILALPDLYDTGGQTEGIGQWGLMSSGNYTKPESPSRYDAWSLEQMGWTTIRPLTTNGTYGLGPTPTADTVFLVDVQGTNTRNEYFLIENRQAVQSDSALIRIHGGGGLLVWHIDGFKACLITACGNSVNAGLIHGVALQEADALRQLWCEEDGCNRGDGGDAYPGTGGNPAFSFGTTPAAIKNSDSSFAGFAVDSIEQLVPDGAMAFRLRFGGLTRVQASDTTVLILVDGAPYNVFQDLFEGGSSHTIAVDTPQFSPSGRTRFGFQSWSDGGAISHSVTGIAAGATYTATLARAHLLNVTVGANGSVGYSSTADTSGTFVAQGTPVTLTATPTPPFVFGGWTGDTTASNPVLTLPMGRPFNLTARFDPQLAITSGDPRPGGLMGRPYADTLLTTGGTGTNTWQVVSGALPTGLTLAANGRITGIPSQTGSFTFTVRVTSGAQQQQQQFGLVITAPTLATAAVVTRLLTGAGALSVDDLKYLDLLGNKNNTFDVGDFLAWVQATGATPAPPVIVAGKGGRP
jgi:M6 family metalloprotease-like protein